jgi:hypothetical protein
MGAAAHGSGAFGETNAVSGKTPAKGCARPIRSLPSAP